VAAFYKVFGLDEVPAGLRRCVLCIGNFDGFHRGHQHVFAAAKEKAKERGVPAVVLTFEPHPRDVFAPNPVMFRLTDGEAKIRLTEALGMDGIIVVPFNRAFSQIEAEDFVQRFLIGALDVSRVIVGEDFHFGRERKGTPEYLRKAGHEHGFVVETLDLLEQGTGPISSSRIREALRRGELDEANELLGYHWFIGGEVVVGDKRGRELGYPTANIAVPPVFELAQGVYAVRAEIGGELLDGVASYGKPMFGDARPPFETYLFDFEGDLYGKHMNVALLARIRGQEIFSGLPELISAIDRDAAKARSLTATAEPLSALDRRLGFFR
jgi:riboflavin kinase/FMN adenylyltransferase